MALLLAALGLGEGLAQEGGLAGGDQTVAAQAAARQFGFTPEEISRLKSQYASGQLSAGQINELCSRLKAKNLGPEEAQSIANSMGLGAAEREQIQQCLGGSGLQQAKGGRQEHQSAGTQGEKPAPQKAAAARPAGESSIEANFRALSQPGSEPAQPTPEKLSQFGYSVFAGNVSTFASVDNVPVGDDYQIGPGDTIDLHLWGRINRSLSLKVERDGRVMIPQIGPLQVSGLRFGQAKQLLESEAGQITGVKVAVTMGRLRTIQVFVIGEVKQPGVYTISALSHVSNALVAAGGVSKVGSLRTVELRRGNNVAEVIDLYDLLLHGRAGNDVRLEPQDVIFVPVIGAVAAVAGDVKRPAIYELSKDGDTLWDLLRMAGGISAFGYTQRVQVESIQNHVRRVTLDVNAGAARSRRFNVRDGDLVKVYPVLTRRNNIVTLKGNVNRAGAYQWRRGMLVSDLIREGEGLADRTFFKYALILRQEGATRTAHYIPIDLGAALSGRFQAEADIPLRPRDELRIFRDDEMRDRPLVRVSGEVRKAGQYPLSPGMRVSDLVYLAGGLVERAYRKRAELDRVHIVDGADIRHGHIDVDLELALSGSRNEDRLLQADDHLYVRGIIDKYPPGGATVMADGQVRKTGKYPWHSGMRVSDLVFAAGGLAESAYLKKAELARARVIDGEKTKHVNMGIDLGGALQGSDADLALQPNDKLLVLQAPGWHLPWIATVTGEVLKPGPYPVLQGERLSDLLVRCGGLMPDAYLRGAVFIRRSVQRMEQERLDESRGRLRKRVAEMKLRAQNVGAVAAQAGANPQAVGQAAKTLDYLQRMLEETESQKATGRVVIHLASLNELATSPENVEIENGDELAIPKRPASVQVMGQVYNPTAVVYQPALTVRDYLWRAGGPAENADGGNVYVIKADGAILNEQGLKNSPRAHAFPLLPVISGGLMSARLEPGDTIYVPEKIELTNKLQIWKDIATIVGQSMMGLGIVGLLATR